MFFSCSRKYYLFYNKDIFVPIFFNNLSFFILINKLYLRRPIKNIDTWERKNSEPVIKSQTILYTEKSNLFNKDKK